MNPERELWDKRESNSKGRTLSLTFKELAKKEKAERGHCQESQRTLTLIITITIVKRDFVLHEANYILRVFL